MSAELERWLKAGRHLPKPMRDFQKAKSVFKLLHFRTGDALNEANAAGMHMPTWIDAHCYVVDFFLYFMARRGWTLQRTRADLPFRDLEADIKEMDAEMSKAFAAMLATKEAGK